MVSRPRRVLGYVRVSSLAQAAEDKKSLDDQRASIQRYAANLGAPVHAIYKDEESGAKDDRAQAMACLAEARPGDVVVVDKIDRFSRDQVWGLTWARDLVARGIGFYAVAESLDASTPQGNSMLGIMLWAAEQERERIKVRMVGNRKLRRTEGFYSEGKPPRGYRRGDDGPNKNVLVIDTRTVAEVWGEDKKPLTAHMRECDVIKEAFAWAIQGRTLKEICNGLELHKTSDTLKNRAYLGEIRKSGAYVIVRDETGKPKIGKTGKPLKRRDAGDTWIEGKHKALLTKAVFNAAQEAIAGRVRKRAHRTSAKAWFLIAGHAYCAKCGAAMIGTWVDGPKRNLATYYKCFGPAHVDKKGRRTYTPCKPDKGERIQIPADTIDTTVRNAILGHLAHVRRVLEHGTPKPAKAPNTEAKRKALNEKRARIGEAFIDGAISRDVMRERQAKIDGELATLGAPVVEVSAGERRGALAEFDRWWKRTETALKDPAKGPAIVQAVLERVELRRPTKQAETLVNGKWERFEHDKWLIPAPVYTWRFPDDAHLTPDGLAKFMPRLTAIARILG